MAPAPVVKHSPPGLTGGDDGDIDDGGGDGGDIGGNDDIADGGDMDVFPIPCGAVVYEGAKGLEWAEGN